jgi:hypothetical protein
MTGLRDGSGAGGSSGSISPLGAYLQDLSRIHPERSSPGHPDVGVLRCGIR